MPSAANAYRQPLPTFDPYSGGSSAPSPFRPYSNSDGAYGPGPVYGADQTYAPGPDYGASQPYGLDPNYGGDPAYGGGAPYGPGAFFGTAQRLLQRVRIENTWLSRMGNRGFGTEDIDMNATFALPFLQNPAPLLITPGFTYHAWDGPASGSFFGHPDLPPRAYDAYLDTAWRPQISPWFAADLGLRVGVYSDFNRVNHDSLRFIGRGLGVVTFNPSWQFALGVVYLDRLRVKILPAGGLIWTPNADTRWEILFPNPKLSQRLATFGNTDVWWYVSGEYGGSNWTIERANGLADRVDYNDMRAIFGLEAFGYQGWTGFFEVGYVFSREIIYHSTGPPVKPSDTVMLRAGLSF